MSVLSSQNYLMEKDSTFCSKGTASMHLVRNLTIPPFSSITDDEYRGTSEFQVGFDDGVKWLLRVPRQDHRSPASDLEALVVSSEVTTLGILKKGGIKVPDIWVPQKIAQGAAPGNYFFQEFVNGSEILFDAFATGLISTSNALYEDVVLHYIGLSNIKRNVKGIGSLYPSGDADYVLPISRRGSFMRPEAPYFFGPFRTLRDQYLAHIQQLIEYTLDIGYIAVLRSPIHCILLLLELRDLVKDCELLAKEEDEFLIHHGDLNIGQCLKNEKGGIASVLDWDWSFTHNYQGRSLRITFLQYAPMRGMLFQQHGRSDLAGCILQGRIYLRINEALSLESPYPMFYLEDPGPIIGIRSAFRDLGQKGVGGHVESLEEWQREGLGKYENEVVLAEMKTRHTEWEELNERGVDMSESEMEEVFEKELALVEAARKEAKVD
ncbi:hypothetical protein L198_04844 [Cryptococcus wingfieldii CBS 7118]|uniref:Aminoglycoside phosphotransferase domain-containing protein n=1 Tax=Cryptococcus wingfieldii CBS 7118 TaxID=1295528 RepID=A0A1E3J1F9_9TREE|nr:hypothetical protein L198_04844 [Cryptococcus wingfieldii CBS 7118]ODN94703.1 hypothetical protein L198_04844 [Cryptococcus wingfieldii CBS 7118]